MTPRTVDGVAELRSLLGQQVGVSDWITVTQQRIDQFADATGDHQWIHVDAERAARESPFQGTIAHGFLTLSLLPMLSWEAVKLTGDFKMSINYGLNRVRFVSPLRVGSKIRGRFTINAVDELDRAVQIVWGVTVEAEGQEKPCLVAEWLTRAYRGDPPASR